MKVIIIDGVIGWDVTAGDIREQLKTAGPDEEIRLEISSPGGSVSEGLTIYNLLADHKGEIHVRLNGVVASMATYISTVGDDITGAANSVYMIHNPIAFDFGDYRVFEKAASLMKKWTSLLARAYKKRTGNDTKTIRDWMDDDTYWFGKEIEDAGFADSIDDDGADDENTRGDAILNARAMFDAAAKQVKALESDVEPEFKIAAMRNNKKTDVTTEEDEAMNLEKLKSEHPEVYKECVAIGARAERDRVEAHLTLADACDGYEIAHAFIRDGTSSLCEKATAQYQAAGIRMAGKADRAGEDVGDVHTDEKKDAQSKWDRDFEKQFNELQGVTE